MSETPISLYSISYRHLPHFERRYILHFTTLCITTTAAAAAAATVMKWRMKLKVFLCDDRQALRSPNPNILAAARHQTVFAALCTREFTTARPLHETIVITYITARISIQTAGLAFGGTCLCAYRVRGVDGSCAKHLTVEFLLVFHRPLSLLFQT